MWRHTGKWPAVSSLHGSRKDQGQSSEGEAEQERSRDRGSEGLLCQRWSMPVGRQPDGVGEDFRRGAAGGFENWRPPRAMLVKGLKARE